MTPILPPAVELNDITKSFGRLVANDAVSMRVAQGSIHALVGENGAGKTTLMKILFGLYQPDRGTIRLAGEEAKLRSPADALRRGLGMVHQHFMLVPTFTVAENLTLGHEKTRGPLLDVARAASEIRALSERFGLKVDPDAKVENLSVGEEQRVEILKALYHGAKTLILDEPTAVLTPQETEDLFRVLRALKNDGATVLLITHKLREVLDVTDRVTVMRGGRVVGERATEKTTIAELAELMVGRPVLLEVPKDPAQPGRPVLEITDLEVHDDRGLPAVHGLSLTVRAGEIVGVAGVEGNGQNELVEAITGLRAITGGDVRLDGQSLRRLTPRAIKERGVSHVPADRLKRGLVLDYSLADNLIFGRHREPAFGKGVTLDRAAIKDNADRMLEAFDVRPRRREAPARQLSGGNQQKVIVAREFTKAGELLLAAHPTRGIDLGAIEFIHKRIVESRDAGRAVLVVSAELGELLSLCDRVVVIYEGKIAFAAEAKATHERELGEYMTGRQKGVA
jgi:ABC-type uncharacterized transport system ATPase subunit